MCNAGSGGSHPIPSQYATSDNLASVLQGRKQGGSRGAHEPSFLGTKCKLTRKVDVNKAPLIFIQESS